MSFDREVAKEFLTLFDVAMYSACVPFFLMQGTALGAYRDKQFVPTEKDLDFGILIENFHASRIAYALLNRGVEITTFNRHLPGQGSFAICHTIVAQYKGIKADIVGWRKYEGKRYATAPSDVTPHYCIVHDAEIIEDQKTIHFYDRQFKIPADTETYLKREYGDEWRTPKEDHISRTRIYGYLEKIRKDLSKP